MSKKSLPPTFGQQVAYKGGCVPALALAATLVVAACSSGSSPSPSGAYQPPPLVTRQVTTYRDAASHATCWIIEGRDGIAISCLRDAP